MSRYLITAGLLVSAIVLYCIGQQTYAAFLLLGWGCEMAAIAIGTRAAQNAAKVAAVRIRK